MLGLGTSVLLDNRLGETKPVDPVLDRGHRLLERLRFQAQQLARAQLQRERAAPGRGWQPTRSLLLEDVAHVPNAISGRTLQLDLDGVGFFDGLGIVAAQRRVRDIRSSKSISDPIDRRIGLGLQRVLHLNLQDQVRAALEIQAQVDVLRHVLRDRFPSRGDADDSPKAKREHRHDQGDLQCKPSFHADCPWCPAIRRASPPCRRSRCARTPASCRREGCVE